MKHVTMQQHVEPSISWGLEVLAPAHIVRGLENSQNKKAHIDASPQIKKSKSPQAPKFL
jgi:hypothetical protein